MSSKSFLLPAFVIVFVLSSLPVPAAAADGAFGPFGQLRPFSPQWDDGDTWTTKVYYRALSLGKEARLRQRSRQELDAPLYWVYRVTKTRKRKGVELLRVQVKDKDKKRNMVGSLTFMRAQPVKGLPPLTSLLRGKFLKSFRGQPSRTEVEISQIGQSSLPAITENSIIPYDVPVFPLGQREPKSLDEEDRKEKGLFRKTVFAVTADTKKGGGQYAMDVVQKEYENPDPDVFMWPGAKAVLEKNDYPRKDLVGVTFYRPFDNVLVRQLWHRSAPWPLLSYGPWYRTELVYYSGEARRRR